MQDLVVANEFNSSIFSLCIPSNASVMDSKVSIIATCISPQNVLIQNTLANPSLEMNLHKELFPFAQNFQSLIQYTIVLVHHEYYKIII